ncbi:MAG: hypothetical protein Q8R79_00190 [Legionellaceae bacterium]|nr:hypothetical protein [Legionellaceae bacterium]
MALSRYDLSELLPSLAIGNSDAWETFLEGLNEKETIDNLSWIISDTDALTSSYGLTVCAKICEISGNIRNSGCSMYLEIPDRKEKAIELYKKALEIDSTNQLAQYFLNALQVPVLPVVEQSGSHPTMSHQSEHVSPSIPSSVPNSSAPPPIPPSAEPSTPMSPQESFQHAQQVVTKGQEPLYTPSFNHTAHQQQTRPSTGSSTMTHTSPVISLAERQSYLMRHGFDDQLKMVETLAQEWSIRKDEESLLKKLSNKIRGPQTDFRKGLKAVGKESDNIGTARRSVLALSKQLNDAKDAFMADGDGVRLASVCDSAMGGASLVLEKHRKFKAIRPLIDKMLKAFKSFGRVLSDMGKSADQLRTEGPQKRADGPITNFFKPTSAKRLQEARDKTKDAPRGPDIK